MFHPVIFSKNYEKSCLIQILWLKDYNFTDVKGI